MEKEKFNPYQHVTDIIISRLESGELPWMQRFTPEQKALGPARNGNTGRQYTGINKLLLPLPGKYYTFKKIEEAGGHVKKGSKAFTAVFFKMVEKKYTHEATDELTGETVTKEGKQLIPVPRLYYLFHESQIEREGQKEPIPVEAAYSGNPEEDAENIIMQYRFREGLTVDDDATEPSYEVASDTVHIPARQKYASAEMYYLDLFHELGHSTGHPSRLNRPMPARASRGGLYNREELTAAITSANLMDEAGLNSLEAIDSVAAECQNWIAALREDNHMIMWCASRAAKATHFILTGEKTIPES